jgi:hypothetical protein
VLLCLRLSHKILKIDHTFVCHTWLLLRQLVLETHDALISGRDLFAQFFGELLKQIDSLVDDALLILDHTLVVEVLFQELWRVCLLDRT